MTPEKQLGFYLVVANDADEIRLGRNHDEELGFIGSLPLVLGTDNQGQGVVITNVDLPLVTARKQCENQFCIGVSHCMEVAELRETGDILKFQENIREIWRQCLCFRSVRRVLR